MVTGGILSDDPAPRAGGDGAGRGPSGDSEARSGPGQAAVCGGRGAGSGGLCGPAGPDLKGGRDRGGEGVRGVTGRAGGGRQAGRLPSVS